ALAEEGADLQVVPQPHQEHGDHPEEEGHEDEPDERHLVEDEEAEVESHGLTGVEVPEHPGEEGDTEERHPSPAQQVSHATRCAGWGVILPLKVAPLVATSSTVTKAPTRAGSP